VSKRYWSSAAEITRDDLLEMSFQTQWGRATTVEHANTVLRSWNKAKQQLEEKNMKKLFWVAVLYHGGKNRRKTEVVRYPEMELWKSEDAAREATIAKIPAKYKEEYDRLEVVVRPF